MRARTLYIIIAGLLLLPLAGSADNETGGSDQAWDNDPNEQLPDDSTHTTAITNLPEAAQGPGDAQTSLGTAQDQTVRNAYYDLLGRRVQHPTPGKIYIKGGRKVVG